MARKGIVLAGGPGTRLYPIRNVVPKPLLPVYDKPMIYCRLSALKVAALSPALVISTPVDTPRFQAMIGGRSCWRLNLQHGGQLLPEGIAHAFVIRCVFLGNDSRALTLRDNIDDGRDLATPPAHASERPEGASVFERYGVVKFDKSFWTLLIEQKPQTPRSNYAVAGLYLYDSQVVDIAAGLPPSARGELEIGDVSSHYLVSGNLNVEIMGRAYAWLDTRTHDSLIEAPTFVATCRKRQGLLVACPEEIASRKEWISPEQMERLAAPLAKNDYGKYLLKLLRDAVA